MRHCCLFGTAAYTCPPVVGVMKEPGLLVNNWCSVAFVHPCITIGQLYLSIHASPSPVGWLVERLSRWIGRLVDQWANRSVGWSIGQSVNWSGIGRLVVWSVGRALSRIVARSVSRLVGR